MGILYKPTPKDKKLVKELLKVSPENCTRMLKRRNKNLYYYIRSHFSGSVFKAKMYNYAYNMRPKKCPVCNEETPFLSETRGYQTYCSLLCANKSPIVINKTKKTFIRKYGVDNPSKNKNIRLKIKKTFIRNYGVDNPSKCNNILLKTKKTNLKKYGVDTIFKTEEFMDKHKKFMRSFYYNNLKNNKHINNRVHILFSEKEYTNTNLDTYYKFKCKKCNMVFKDHLASGNIPRCLKCYPLNVYYSRGEKEMVDYIKQIYKGKILENTQNVIHPYELDIYLPDKQIAIEYNGLFWHSTLFKDKQYHLNKTRLCKQKNIHLLHILDFEWENKQDIVKNKLNNLLTNNKKPKIYSQSCKVNEIDISLANNFLNLHHIHGECKSTIQLGIFYKNKLCGVMSFCKLTRRNSKYTHKDNVYKLLRYNTINYNIIGIIPKTLKYFKEKYKPSQIIIYIDKRFYSKNNIIYSKYGFKFDGYTKPTCWYFNRQRNRLYHKDEIEKNIIPDKINKYNLNLCDWKKIQINGYNKIWDCGNIIYTLVID